MDCTERGEEGFDVCGIVGVVELPVSEVKCLPFNNDELDIKSRKVMLTGRAQEINALRIVVVYINSRKYREKSAEKIKGDLYIVSRVFNFFNKHKNPEKFINDKSLFQVDLKNWLISEGYEEGGVASTLNAFHNFLKKGCRSESASHLKNDVVINIVNNIKKYDCEYSSVPTLDSVFPGLSLNSTDKDLLIGLREVMSWILKEYNVVREGVVNVMDDRLKKYYSDLKNKKESIKNLNFSTIPAKIKPENNKYCKHTVYLLDAVRKQGSVFGKESAFYGLTRSHTSPNQFLTELMLTEKEIDGVLFHAANLVKPKGHMRKSIHPTLLLPPQKGGGKSCIHRSQAFFPALSFLVHPVRDESTAMVWLLASERVQKTGVVSLDIYKNVVLDRKKRKIQLVEIVKNRSRGKQYGPQYCNDSMYEVFSNWIDLIEKSKNHTHDYDSNFIPSIHNSDRSFQSDKLPQLSAFWLVSSPDTLTHKKLIEDISGGVNEQKIKDFLKLLQHQLRVSSKKTNEKLDRDSRYRGRIESVDKKKRKTRELGISIKTIAQTRAVIDDDIGAGSLVAHTQKTHVNTYLNRTESKYVNAKSATFSADVGNAMRLEAEKLLGKVSLVSVCEVKKILGLENNLENSESLDELNEILSAAESDGFVADLMMELKGFGKVYVVQSPWVSALIKGYIEHINKEMERLEFNNNIKRSDLLVKQLYLNMILDKFPKKIQRQGNSLLEEWDIPFPTLV